MSLKVDASVTYILGHYSRHSPVNIELASALKFKFLVLTKVKTNKYYCLYFYLCPCKLAEVLNNISDNYYKQPLVNM